MKNKKIIITIFLIVILIPLLFTSFYKITDIKLDTTLSGNFDAVKKPDGGVILPIKWFSGQYQSEFNNYFNNTFVPRATMLKTYNQLRYSLFDEGNRIVGKDGSIFETSYLYDALILSDEYNFSLPENQMKMKEYVERLSSIHTKLQAVGKQLIVYTTPSKAVFNANEIPQRYLDERIEAERAIDIFNRYIADTDVIYFNSIEYLQQFTNEQWPVFYKTGIHWSRPAEQLVSKQISDIINTLYDNNSKTIEMGDLQVSENAYWRDSDVYDLLNLWLGEQDKTYYQYELQAVQNGLYDRKNVLLQGGSFSNGLKSDLINNKMCGTFYNIFYKEAVMDTTGNATVFSEWDKLDLNALLNRCNIVVIEANEAVLKDYNKGFVAYLDQFLDTYIPQKVEKDYLQYLDCNTKVSYPESTVYGLYGIEDGFCWSDEYVMIQLKNSALSNNGLQLEFTIPQYLADVSNENDTLSVYVNGELKSSVSLKQVGCQAITLAPNQISSDDGIYTIELYCSKAFVPVELGINNDTRSLAVQIHYIGEAR